MRRPADIELICEVGVDAPVRLHGQIVNAIAGECVCEERIPDEMVLDVAEFGPPLVQQNERRVEPVAIARGSQVEDPGLALACLEAVEVEIFLAVEAGVDGHRRRYRLGEAQTVIGFLFDPMRLIADMENHQARRPPRTDDPEVVRADGRAFADLKLESGGRVAALENAAPQFGVEKYDRACAVEVLSHQLDSQRLAGRPALRKDSGDFREMVSYLPRSGDTGDQREEKDKGFQVNAPPRQIPRARSPRARSTVLDDTPVPDLPRASGAGVSVARVCQWRGRISGARESQRASPPGAASRGDCVQAELPQSRALPSRRFAARAAKPASSTRQSRPDHR